MTMLLLKNHLWAIFQQHFQYRLAIKVSAMLTNLTPPPFCGSIILHKKRQRISFTFQPAIEIYDFNIVVTVHKINKQRNQTAITGH